MSRSTATASSVPFGSRRPRACVWPWPWLIQRDEQGRSTQGRQKVGLGLGGLPEGVELGILELDQALTGLKEFGQVGLIGVEELFQAVDLDLEGVGQAGSLAHQPVCAVPLGDGRLDLGGCPLLGLLEGDQGSAVIGLALNDQRLAVVEEGQGSDVGESEELGPLLVALVERTDHGGRNPVPLGQLDRGAGTGRRRSRGVNFRAALEREPDQALVVERRNIVGQDKLSQGLGGPGRSGVPIWLWRSVRALA